MTKKMKCYFAHPYESRDSPEEIEIIAELKSRRIIVINPFDGEDDMMLKKYNIKKYYPNPPFKLAREIWQKDLRQVNEADMILVYVPDGKRLSGGCGIEMYEAWLKHKYIQIISKSKHPAFAFVLGGGNDQFASIEHWKRHKSMVWE